MIRYDSKSFLSLMQLSGSVFPRSGKYAVLIALVATVLKYADVSGIINMSQIQTGKESTLFNGFTFTLGFILVFRTNQCYTRFHNGAHSACTMRSKMFEAASSIAAFSTHEVAKREKAEEFLHKVVRLFSLAHASALEVICDLPHQEFPVLDLDGLVAEDIGDLARLTGHLRVDLIFQWINRVVIDAVHSGMISAPAPIVSRVYQELEQSKVEFNQMLQIIAIPVPFPYSQVTMVLLMAYSIIAPVMVIFWTNHPATTFFVTFFTTLPLWSIEFIAAEIEHPFGDDVNDLPVFDFQKDINQSLLLLINPCSQKVPRLSPHADLSLHSSHSKSLRQLTKELETSERDCVDDCSVCDELPEEPLGTGELRRPREGEPTKVKLPSSQVSHSPPARLWLRAPTDWSIPGVEQAQPMLIKPATVVTDVQPIVLQVIKCDPKWRSPEEERQSTSKSPGVIEMWSAVEQQQALCLDILNVLKEVIEQIKNESRHIVVI